jgi:peptidyl-prolyl cis-trans isomerase SDCCAG10
MSSIYNLEPLPTASAILHTTLGDLSVELFAKQTPLTCRNFLQLALDGYYDNTIFHRLVPGFILQGGDPTGTGNGGESIYDGGALGGDLDPWPMDERRGKNAGPTGLNFKDEFHSRLKFNRRGLLGMANEGVPDSNGSQFFFTLDKAAELDGKNTLFGRIAGDTIYNLMKMGESELEDGGDRPLYPIKITSIEILVNPFEDLQRREKTALAVSQVNGPSHAAEKKIKRKAGMKLLSFAEDDGEEGDSPSPKRAKFDTRVVMDVKGDADVTAKPKKSNATQKPVGTASTKATIAKDQGPSIPVRPPPRTEPPVDPEAASSPENSPPPSKSLVEKTNEEYAALKASMKRAVAVSPVKEHKKSALEQLIPDTSTRGRKRRPGERNTTEQQDQRSLDLLRAFQSKLSHATEGKSSDTPAQSTESGYAEETVINAEEEVCDLHFIANCQSCQSWDKREIKDDSDDEGWMAHSLSFAVDKLGKDLSYRKKAEEELVVIDPREQARTMQEEKKAVREARPGGTGRAWDQARSANMAQAGALAGRWAR